MLQQRIDGYGAMCGVVWEIFLPSDEYVKRVTKPVVLRAGHGIKWSYSQGILVHYEEIRPIPSESANIECTTYYYYFDLIDLTKPKPKPNPNPNPNPNTNP